MYTERGTRLSCLSWFKHSTTSYQCSDHKHSPIRKPSLSPQGIPTSSREMEPGDGALIQAWVRTLEDPTQQAVGAQRENYLVLGGGQSGMAGLLEGGGGIWARIWAWGYEERFRGYLKQRPEVGGCTWGLSLPGARHPWSRAHLSQHRQKAGHASVSPLPDHAHSRCTTNADFVFEQSHRTSQRKRPKKEIACSSGPQQRWLNLWVSVTGEKWWHLGGRVGWGALSPVQHSEELPGDHVSGITYHTLRLVKTLFINIGTLNLTVLLLDTNLAF